MRRLLPPLALGLLIVAVSAQGALQGTYWDGKDDGILRAVSWHVAQHNASVSVDLWEELGSRSLAGALYIGQIGADEASEVYYMVAARNVSAVIAVHGDGTPMIQNGSAQDQVRIGWAFPRANATEETCAFAIMTSISARGKTDTADSIPNDAAGLTDAWNQGAYCAKAPDGVGDPAKRSSGLGILALFALLPALARRRA